jgi:Type III secretion system regulator (LcrR)
MPFYRDRFTEILDESGWKPSIYQPAAYLGGPPVGWRIEIGPTEFVYRVPEESPDTLIVVLIRRLEQRSGLRSSMAAFVYFLSLVKAGNCGIRWIIGCVEPTSDRPADSLAAKRIAAFYLGYLKSWMISEPNREGWIRGDLSTFVPPVGRTDFVPKPKQL